MVTVWQCVSSYPGPMADVRKTTSTSPTTTPARTKSAAPTRTTAKSNASASQPIRDRATISKEATAASSAPSKRHVDALKGAYTEKTPEQLGKAAQGGDAEARQKLRDQMGCEDFKTEMFMRD